MNKRIDCKFTLEQAVLIIKDYIEEHPDEAENLRTYLRECPLKDDLESEEVLAVIIKQVSAHPQKYLTKVSDGLTDEELDEVTGGGMFTGCTFNPATTLKGYAEHGAGNIEMFVGLVTFDEELKTKGTHLSEQGRHDICKGRHINDISPPN